MPLSHEEQMEHRDSLLLTSREERQKLSQEVEAEKCPEKHNGKRKS